ncbi:MAG: complex I NDUFA9 subunit family protein [Parasphingorhabdus sp.]|nr:complex I NDUFA9 subunit family protein [Parasphingorhabdus sp.]
MDLADRLVVIFGGGGFLGRYVAEALLSRGARVRVAERNPKNALFIKPLGNLGQTQFAFADITKPQTVARALHGADAVVNLVGIFGRGMAAVNGEGAGNIARAAHDAGVHSLVHVSAIGADPNSPSDYGRSKAAGEKAVLNAFPNATILRPSIVFGQEDAFVNRFAGLIAALPIVPIIGGATKFQPVFVGDVAQSIAFAVADPEHFGGSTFELGGPDVISMAELNRQIAAWTGRKPFFIDVPDFAAKAMAITTGPLPGAPITHDQFKMLQRDNVVSAGAAGLAELGVHPTPMAAVVPRWLDRFRLHGRFGARAKAE